MSKSKKNFITLRELVREEGPIASRIALINQHYRTQGDFSKEKADAARKRYERLTRTYHFALQTLSETETECNPSLVREMLTKFNTAMADDLNTPLAFTVINEVATAMEESRINEDLVKLKSLVDLFETLMGVLGIPLNHLSKDEIKYINTLVNFRLELRGEKKWAESDTIRDFLRSLNYNLNDVSKEKTEWFKL